MILRLKMYLIINMICPLCNLESVTIRSLTAHMRCFHKLSIDVYKEILFQKYPELFISCLECGIKIKKFPNAGGAETCSIDCRKKTKHKINLNRKQSDDQIKNRILATDQIRKENSRKNTMLEKYGSLIYIPNEKERSLKISSSLKGRKKTDEHIQKIIDSKRSNGTNNHSMSAYGFVYNLHNIYI